MTVTQKDRLVIFKTVVHAFNSKVADKIEARDLESRKGAKKGTSKVLVELLPEEYRKKIVSLHSELRKYIYTMSLTWDDNGWRAVPAGKFAEFEAGFEKHRKAFKDEAVRLESLREEIDEVNKSGRLGTDWSERFKIPADLASRYGADDFSFGTDDCEAKLDQIEAGLAARITESRQKQVQSQIEGCAKELSERVLAMAQQMIERFSPKDVKGAKFTDFLDSIRETAIAVRSLNFTGDAALEQMADELAKAVDAMSDDALKASPKKRQEIVGKAQSIAQRLLGSKQQAPVEAPAKANQPAKVVTTVPAPKAASIPLPVRPAAPAPAPVVVAPSAMSLASRLLGKR